MDEESNILFTVGPLEMSKEIIDVGLKKIPYFRTQSFSKINLDICEYIKKVVFTSSESRVALLTCSGSGAMEAAVINTFSKEDKLLIVDGGDFGRRFKTICDIHDFKYDLIKINESEELTKEILDKYKNNGYTGFLVNCHETSIGKYHNMNIISDFCKNENLILIVDAISSFLADEYYMDKWNVGVTIISSQKALALPPGMSIVIVNEAVYKKIIDNDVKSLYLNLQNEFKNMERGQTTFTPAVGIILQMHYRLKQIFERGVNFEVDKVKKLAEDFRKKIAENDDKLSVYIPNRRLSNALTPLRVKGNISALEIVKYLMDNYNIYVCPNGGEFKNDIFRVGHIGNLTIEDNDKLINALIDFEEKRKK